MKTILFACIALAFGCASAVKPLVLKPLEPPSDFAKKRVVVDLPSKEMYNISCTGELYAELFQQQHDQWIPVHNQFDPSSSQTAFYLDGKFSESTMVGFGCDEAYCKSVTPPIRLDLVRFQKLGEKVSPLYAKDPNHERKMIPSYKTNLLSGHFKATYEYYKDSKCDKRSREEHEIEFDVD